MSANLTAYYWAEQENRQRLSGRAERGWLAEEAAANRPCASRAATLRQTTGALLVRIRAHLQGVGPVPALGAPDGTLSQA